MIVYVVALLEALVYLAAIPVDLVVSADGLTARAAVSAFGLRPRPGGGKGGGPGFSEVWPVLRRLRFERVALTGQVSLGDAAATALLCGALNGAGRCLRARPDRLHVAVTPVFSGDIRVELRGMLRARTGRIALAIVQSRKGRIMEWINTRSKAS